MFGQLNRKKEGHSQVEIRECFWYNWKHKIHHLGEEDYKYLKMKNITWKSMAIAIHTLEVLV